MPWFKLARQIQAPNASTDMMDYECIVTLSTSGATVLTNALAQGEVVCTDITVNVPNTATGPFCEFAVPAPAAAAGMPLGVYQGATLTNASTTATSTAAILVRKFGFGQILVAGGTTNVLVGDNVSIKPASSTPQAAQKLVAAEGLTAGAASYFVATITATTGLTTAGAVVSSSTTYQLVNGYINI